MAVGVQVPGSGRLPSLRGATRRIVVLAVLGYGLFLMVQWRLPEIHEMVKLMIDNLALNPSLIAKKELWQWFTYPFIEPRWQSLMVGLGTIWWFGSLLEAERGWRWMGEYYLVTTAGGGALACGVGLVAGRWVAGVTGNIGMRGMWPFALALVVAYAASHPEELLWPWLRVPLKARYVAGVYVVAYVATELGRGDRFSTLTTMCGVLLGLGFVQFAPRRGVRSGTRQWLVGLRASRAGR